MILYDKCTKISIYCTKKYIICELLLERREGAALFAGEMGAGAGKVLGRWG